MLISLQCKSFNSIDVKIHRPRKSSSNINFPSLFHRSFIYNYRYIYISKLLLTTTKTHYVKNINFIIYIYHIVVFIK